MLKQIARYILRDEIDDYENIIGDLCFKTTELMNEVENLKSIINESKEYEKIYEEDFKYLLRENRLMTLIIGACELYGKEN